MNNDKIADESNNSKTRDERIAEEMDYIKNHPDYRNHLKDWLGEDGLAVYLEKIGEGLSWNEAYNSAKAYLRQKYARNPKKVNLNISYVSTHEKAEEMHTPEEWKRIKLKK